jgi:hypothetical protein
MTDLRRRKELAKIHLGAKAIGLKDDAYRDMLRLVTGKESAGDLSQAERVQVLEHLKSKGFDERRKPPKRAGTRPRDESAEAAKIRALWLALYQLGAVRDPSEAAIGAYVKRMSGKDAIQFLQQRDIAKVVNTLRAWCERAGFVEPDAASVQFFDSLRERCGLDAGGHGLAAKCALIKVLWQRARIAGSVEVWLHGRYRVQDVWALSPADADDAIEQLGQRARRYEPARQAEPAANSNRSGR